MGYACHGGGGGACHGLLRKAKVVAPQFTLPALGIPCVTRRQGCFPAVSRSVRPPRGGAPVGFCGLHTFQHGAVMHTIHVVSGSGPYPMAYPVTRGKSWAVPVLGLAPEAPSAPSQSKPYHASSGGSPGVYSLPSRGGFVAGSCPPERLLASSQLSPPVRRVLRLCTSPRPWRGSSDAQHKHGVRGFPRIRASRLAH
jgi:hypothetical protein